MKNWLKLLTICCLGFFYSAEAQVVVKRDTISGTELVMAMDSKVSELLDGMEESCARTASKAAVHDVSSSHTKTTGGKVLVPNRALTNAEICRKNPRLLGYKIQVAVVKSNDEANEIKVKFRRLFPSMKVQVDASLRPNYKILAGSYFSKESAKSDLAQVRKEFSGASTVQYQIFCVEAK